MFLNVRGKECFVQREALIQEAFLGQDLSLTPAKGQMMIKYVYGGNTEAFIFLGQ